MQEIFLILVYFGYGTVLFCIQAQTAPAVSKRKEGRAYYFYVSGSSDVAGGFPPF